MFISVDALSNALPVSAIMLAMVLFALTGLKHPWPLTAMALISLVIVPFWMGAAVSIFFVSGHLALMLLSIVSVAAESREKLQFTLPDIILTSVLLVTLVCFVLGLVGITQVYSFFQWMAAYWFARIVSTVYGIPRLATILAIATPVVAMLLLYETASGQNVFLDYLSMNNDQFRQWSGQQIRGDAIRAEGPFGHSIAAGSSLAVFAILSLDARLRFRTRLILVVVICAGIAATISRISFVTVGLGIAVVLLLARSSLHRKQKLTIVALVVPLVIAVQPLLGSVFADSGDEATNSAAYRTWILDLVGTLEPFGFASSFGRSTSGTTSFGDFGSIDNAVLFYALTNGWVPAAILLALLLAAVFQLLRGNGGVATAALVAQIPAMFTVALITSYSHVLWISAGLAVTELHAAALRHQPSLPSAPRRQLVDSY
ncbi:MAG: hypothetical protein QM713_09065 [Arachnia sp.]